MTTLHQKMLRQLRPAHNANSEPKSKRLDVQGLRAFAVLVVIANHLTGWPSGGFAGVDIFFVISGFLITGLLLREWESTEHISFIRFYARRIKRIVPAATVVLVFTVLAAMIVTPSSVAASVRLDALAAFFFVSNWRFLASGTDYFQEGLPPSPLQHYWSLSVEEQFYFVWPWLMLAILSILATARVRMRWDRRAAAGAITIVSIASFGWAWGQSEANATSAYFSSLTRVWELGLGALIACLAPLFARLPNRLRPLSAWAGLSGIVLTLFVISPTSTWPGPWATLPVGATAMVIASGCGQEPRYLVPLTNPVSVYVGDISYSLYLWHFPLIVLSEYVLDPGPVRSLMVLVLTTAMSICSYHGIEKPLHTSPLLVRQPSGGARSVAWRAWREKTRVGATLGLVGLVALVTSLMAYQALSPAATARASSTAPAGSIDQASVTTKCLGAAALDTALTNLEISWRDGLKPVA